MNKNIIKTICKCSDMAFFSTGDLLDKMNEKNFKIKPLILDINKEYFKYYEISKDILNKNNLEISNSNIFVKLMSSFAVYKKSLFDFDDSKIAKIMIDGILIGVNDIEKALDIDDYNEYKKLVISFQNFQNNTINELEKYLWFL